MSYGNKNLQKSENQIPYVTYRIMLQLNVTRYALNMYDREKYSNFVEFVPYRNVQYRIIFHPIYYTINSEYKLSFCQSLFILKISPLRSK